MSKTIRTGLVLTAVLAATPAMAHVGNHDHVASAWHFVTGPAHLLPVLVLAAVVVGGLIARGRYREQARRRIDES